MPVNFLVTAEWDEDAKVWVATSDAIPGLVTEASTIDALLHRIEMVAPELLADNAHLLDSQQEGGMIDLRILSSLKRSRAA